ncbi:MAG TPA: 4Fe-4S dicluster domain-containing protein [Candidatus Coatesbacteria bacterium]|nr:4Fe-4S dicluster domain-containing protein [Candidatus Coatesbacteria bacterium]
MTEEGGFNIHCVCTHEEARRLIEAQSGFRLTNCGCREETGDCKRSRTDVCLMFPGAKEVSDNGSPWNISREEALAILREAVNKRLVARPWREETPKRADGICFCCDCCCSYFREPGRWSCDRGTMVERTDPESCAECGSCIEVCYFGARSIELDDGGLVIETERCYGCGLCAEVCPNGAVALVPR